jgi:type I restriction enzyme M protein
MAQLDQLEAIEKRLWSSADNLRANSNYASNEYFLPVMGLIFLRHAYSRYLAVRDGIEAHLPKRGGKTRPLTKEDFSQKSAIFLRPEAQFDYLVELPEQADRAQGIIGAMESIEADYETLKGVLPKSEYQEVDNAVLGQLLRTFNDPALKSASGDIFGRIYEYFLTQFADLKAHDNGEFFTPVSLVQMLVNVIEPDHGTVLDPACGSGGMFVQSAHFIEHLHLNPQDRATFYGMEKNATTIRLAKMNLAVHGLEGNIQQAITYYQDPHELLRKADFVMANPPFNVDEVDADKVKNDPRLPFGLPGVNKKGAVSNGNYLWISYFYSYLNERGRAGFVMSSQASSAGRDEAIVRRKLVETGHVDVMIAIRSNFFYTRTVPCELWFFDKDKPEHLRDTVLMLDARNIYRKVTRKIYDFSPEQHQNLTAIVWLYRGQTDKFLGLVKEYLEAIGRECALIPDRLTQFETTLNAVRVKFTATESLRAERSNLCSKKEIASSLAAPRNDSNLVKLDAGSNGAPLSDFSQALAEFQEAEKLYEDDRTLLVQEIADYRKKFCVTLPTNNKEQHAARAAFDPIDERLKGLIKQIDLLYKLAARTGDAANKLGSELSSSPLSPGGRELERGGTNGYTHRAATQLLKQLDETRKDAVEQLRQAVYFHRQVVWLQERFPDATLQAVPGLVKLVDRKEIAAADWSLTPGRYVGVAPPEEDENFDFEETLRDIHVELASLNEEAVDLARKIQENFAGLGI